MIPVLDELKPEEATEVLTRAASLVLPNPHGHTTEVEGSDQRAAEVVKSLKDHIGRVHFEGNVDAEVFRLLTDRLTRPYLTEQNTPAIIARLSDKRLLPQRYYQLVFHPAFKATADLIQVRPTHVEEAIRSADQVQRISLSEHAGPDDIFTPMSVFVKYHRGGKRGEFAILVQCFHEEGKLVIFNAWKIFPADIPRPYDESPLALLCAFLQSFGLKISFAGRPLTSLIINDVFPNEDNNFALCKTERRPGMHLTHYMKIHFSSLGSIAVSIAFAVDLDTYLASLVKRGVPVDWTGINQFTSEDRQGAMDVIRGS